MIKRLAAVATLLLVQSVLAKPKYEFTTKLSPGASGQFEYTRDTRMKYLPSSGQGDANGSSTHHVESETGTLSVLEVRTGTPTAFRIAFDASSGATDDGNSSELTPSPFAGHSLVIRRGDDDKVTDDFTGNADNDARDQLHGWLDPDSDYFPDVPVSVGDAWEVSEKVSRHADLGAEEHLLCHVRLDWVKRISGRRTAKLSIVMAVLRHDEPHEHSITAVSGTCLMDVECGVIFKSDSQGTIEIINGEKGAFRTVGKGTFTEHEAWKPTSWKNSSVPATQPAASD